MRRREFLYGLAAAALSSSRLPAIAKAVPAASKQLGIPGPFRGRVVSVHHPGTYITGKYQADPLRQVIQKGMTELTGAPAWADAWRFFFEPGDVVGIKVNGVGTNTFGAPFVISSPETLRHIIDGLEQAGVKRRDIFVFDRYKDTYLRAGFDKWLPEGVRPAWATEERDPFQLDMAGYDPDHYMEMALVLPGADPRDHHFRRSYVAKFVTQRVNKLINLPVLKHHEAAGVTLALKNMSHGLHNNVNRSHFDIATNSTVSFIPTAVDNAVIREKVVLHILDGTLGAYHAGPGGGTQIHKYIWEHKTMYFATDPVSLDKIGLRAIDEKRAAVGMPAVAHSLGDPGRMIHLAPEHIEVAGVIGLGEFDDSKIEWKKFQLA